MSYFRNNNTNKGRTKTNMSNNKETVKDILQYPYADMPERGIRQETCKLFNVRMALSTADGETPKAYYYPYYNNRSELIGWKKRDLTLAKEDKYHFTTIGKVGVSCKLFGQQVAERQHRKRKRLFYVEGENDVLALHQAFIDSLPEKWAHLVPFVVGLNCGTGNAVDSTQHNLEFIKSFGEIVLGFDNDRATDRERKKGIVKGVECTDDVAACIMQDNILTVEYPHDIKDPNEMLLSEQHGPDALQKLFAFGTKKYVAEKIVTAGDILFEDFIRPKEEGVYINAFPKLMQKTHGLRKGELVTVTAPSGCGKSTTVAEFSYSLGEAGKKVGLIFLEEENKETLQRMAAKKLKKNFIKFSKNPLSVATQEELRSAYDWLKDEDRFVLLDHFGSLRVKELMNKIKNLYFIHKVDFIVLDHLSMVVSGSEVDERKELELLMTELAAFVSSHDLGIIAVSHLNRDISKDFRPPKDKENQPFWVNIRKEALKGASGLEQMSWVILALEPEIMPDRSRGRVRWVVLKNRPWSLLGVADVFNMDDETGEFIDQEFEEF